jgi:hypothetical protein
MSKIDAVTRFNLGLIQSRIQAALKEVGGGARHHPPESRRPLGLVGRGRGV